MPRITSLKVNGEKRQVDADPTASLLSVLRNDLTLTGTKYGCGEGQCGACTVLLNNRMTRSCITPVGRAAGQEITTIEGLANKGQLHPLQEAFLKADALQCGYCTSGMIMSGLALLKATPKPTRTQIVSHMDKNVCRCGTYQRIVTAIEMAADRKS